MKKLFKHRRDWKDQFGAHFSFGRVNSHPIFISFGESLIWSTGQDENEMMEIDSDSEDSGNNNHNKDQGSKQNDIMEIDGDDIETDSEHSDNNNHNNNHNKKTTKGCWKLKSHPNEMYFWMFTDLKTKPCRVKIYKTHALEKFKSKPKHTQIINNQQKVIKRCPGWKISTFQAIIELAELSYTKQKKAILQYYGQNGVRKAAKKQTLTPGTVSTANVFIGKRRQRMHQDIILGKASHEHLPVQVCKDSVHSKLKICQQT